MTAAKVLGEASKPIISPRRSLRLELLGGERARLQAALAQALLAVLLPVPPQSRAVDVAVRQRLRAVNSSSSAAHTPATSRSRRHDAHELRRRPEEHRRGEEVEARDGGGELVARPRAVLRTRQDAEDADQRRAPTSGGCGTCGRSRRARARAGPAPTRAGRARATSPAPGPRGTGGEPGVTSSGSRRISSIVARASTSASDEHERDARQPGRRGLLAGGDAGGRGVLRACGLASWREA